MGQNSIKTFISLPVSRNKNLELVSRTHLCLGFEFDCDLVARAQKQRKLDSEVEKIGAAAAHTSTFVMIGKFASIIFLGLAFIIVARLLGPSQYGIYTLALAVASVTGAIGNLGVSTALNKFIPEYVYRKDKRALEDILANSFFVTLLMGILLTAITIALSGFIATDVFHNASYTLVIEIAAISIISSMLFSASYSTLLGFNKGAHVAAINATQAILQAVLGVTLVLLGLGPAGPILGMIVGYTAAFLLSLHFIYRKHGLRILVMPNRASIKRIFGFSVPIAVSNAAVGISSNMVYIVVGAYAAAAVIGNLGVASKANSLIDIVSGAISVSLLSMYSTTLASKKMRAKISNFYNHTVYYSLILLAPMLLFILVLAKPFSYVAFSGAYSMAPLFIAVMSAGALVGLAGQYAITLLTSANKVRDIFKYNLVIAMLTLALIPILIPTFKGVGLVIILFVAVPITTNVLFIWKSAKLFKLGFDNSKLFRILAANAATMLLITPLILLWGANYIPLLITAAVEVIAVYPVMLGILKGINVRDIAVMRTMTRRIPVISPAVNFLLAYAARFAR